MLNIVDIFLPFKKRSAIKLISIYFLTLLFFLITKTDGYACDGNATGHIKFSNKTHIPVDIVISRTHKQTRVVLKCLRKNSKTKKCEPRSSRTAIITEKIVEDKKITLPAKTTSGGICWEEPADNDGKLSHFKTSFKYNGETMQGPEGNISVGRNDIFAYAYGKINKHEGNQEYITSSDCEKSHTICTVYLKKRK